MQQCDLMTMIGEYSNQQHQLTEENISDLTYASHKASNTLSSMPLKKKRPGNPDPEAEVIALSPNTLMATHRFSCEICSKRFHRDQNLQLHKRKHNLPWTLQKRCKEVRKKVYVCPEVGCVHHDPSRALGDITGIKKHFYRKHGEKKWECQTCSKKYAVISDLKSHSKICSRRELKCDCGAIFFRTDTFNTHKAFCVALPDENATTITNPLIADHPILFSQPPYDLTLLALSVCQTYSTTLTESNFLIMNTSNGLQELSLNGKDYQLPEFNLWPDTRQLHYQASPHMSATELLQRAAQIGSTFSTPQQTQMATHTEGSAGYGLELYTHQDMGYMQSPSHLLCDTTTTTSVSLADQFDVCFNVAFQGMVGSEHQMRSISNEQGGSDGLTRDFLGTLPDRDLLSLAGLAPLHKI